MDILQTETPDSWYTDILLILLINILLPVYISQSIMGTKLQFQILGAWLSPHIKVGQKNGSDKIHSNYFEHVALGSPTVSDSYIIDYYEGFLGVRLWNTKVSE